MSAALKSYTKSTAACLVFVAICAASAVLALAHLPRAAGLVVAALATLAAAAGALLVSACTTVLWRHWRAMRGKRDLFLELNSSREPGAIELAAVRQRIRLRRWLAQQLLGHELIVGDMVEIKPWAEIRATLDERGCLEELPFMPEMLAMCGRRARVFRGMHRLFDYRKSRRMRHMTGAVLLVGAICDGSNHGGCEAACHTIWKAAWLRRIGPEHDAVSTLPPPSDPPPVNGTSVLEFGTRAPRYTCQLTQLHAASAPIGNRNIIDFWRPVVAGNVAPAAFVVGWLTHLFNELQHYRGGIGFPAFEMGHCSNEKHDDARFAPGDPVVVRSSAAIRATLNDQLTHRGMGFEPDMLKHCGGCYRIQAEIGKLIDIVTGEMRTMKTPAYVLRGVHFSGERQLFNAQYEPLFWRGVWLHREESQVCPTVQLPTAPHQVTRTP